MKGVRGRGRGGNGGRDKVVPLEQALVGAGSLGPAPSLARRNLSVRSRRLTMWPPR